MPGRVPRTRAGIVLGGPASFAGTPIAAPAGEVASLLPNPSFETDLTGWGSFGTLVATRDPGHPQLGSWSAKCVAIAANDRFVANTVPALTPGVTYTFSVLLYIESLTANGVQLQVQDGDGLGPTVTSGAIVSTVGSVVLLSVTFLASATAGVHVFRIRQDGAGAATWYADAARLDVTDPVAAAESLLALVASGASGVADAAATVAALIAAASAAGVADARVIVAALAQSVAAAGLADSRSTSATLTQSGAAGVADARSTSATLLPAVAGTNVGDARTTPVLLPTTAPGTYGLGEVETVAFLLASSGAAGISDAAAALILVAASGSSGLADARAASLGLVPSGSGDEEETVTASFTFVATGTAVVHDAPAAPAGGEGWVPATHWPTRRARVEPAPPPPDPRAEAVATIRLATSSRSAVAAAAFSRLELRTEGAHLVEWTAAAFDDDDAEVVSYLLAMVA